MAALKYRDEHNKVGFLEKPKGSADYHQVLDFVWVFAHKGMLLPDPIIYDSIGHTVLSTAIILEASEEGPPSTGHH
ncbi:hypothetical protein Tco_1370356 [Tanacetum coccineum]